MAIALLGQFSARFQADESLQRLVAKTSNAALKKSAFLLLNSEKRRNEEYERLKEEDASNNRQNTVTFRITSTPSHRGGAIPSAGFILVILMAIYMTALVLLWNIA